MTGFQTGIGKGRGSAWGGGGFVPALVFALVLVAVVAGFGRPAAAQGLFGGGDDDRRTAEMGVRVNQMEGQMRALNGQIEQLSFQIRQLQDTMVRMQKDYEFRLQEIENGGAKAQAKPPQKRSEAAPAAVEPTAMADAGAASAVAASPEPARAPVRGAPPAPLGQLSSADPIGGLIGSSAPLDLGAPGVPVSSPEGRSVGGLGDPVVAAVPGVDPRYASTPPTASPRDEYDAAYGYILNGEYALAETSFKTFLANHPTDKRIGAAQFWLGESYFARARHKEAADAFLKSYTQFPDGSKAPDSLLKLGMALAGLGEKKAACASWDELLVKFPKASKAVRDRAASEKTRGKC
jgi:tol-pal system protein YbgF